MKFIPVMVPCTNLLANFQIKNSSFRPLLDLLGQHQVRTNTQVMTNSSAIAECFESHFIPHDDHKDD